MTEDTSSPENRTARVSNERPTDDATQLSADGASGDESGPISRRQFLLSSAAAGALALGASGSAAGATVVKQTCSNMDSILLENGEFEAINNMWTTTDVNQCTYLYDDSSYGWEWDRGTTSASDPNYPQTLIGTKPWGDFGTDTSLFPIQRKNVDTLEMTIDVDLTPSGGEWNLAEEWWLTSQKPAKGTDVSSSITHEVMLVLDWGPDHGHNGTIENSIATDAFGNTFDYWAQYDIGWSFHIFRVQGGMSTGDVDFTPIMDYMANNFGVGGDLWMSGIEVGNEYWDNTTGKTRFYQFDVTRNSATATSGPNGGTSSGSGSTQSPYGGSAWPIPGTIEAEDFDEGGQDVAYSDSTAGEEDGTNEYRSTDVDIGGDDEGDYAASYIASGEWLEYTVNVDADGNYDLTARVASSGGGGPFHVEIDGTDVTGNISVPDTGGWNTYTTVTVSDVSLTAGEHVMRVAMGGGMFNLDHLDWASASSSGDSTAPTAPSNLSSPAHGSSSVDLNWDAASDSGSGVDHYNVYVDSTRDHQVAAGTTSTTVSSLSSGTSYDFAVTAVDGAGNESSQSNVITVTTDSSSGSSNLLTDPGFENGGTDWSSLASFTTVTSPTNSGSYAGQASNRSNSWEGIRQDVTTELSNNGTGTYSVSGHACLGSGTGKARITVMIDDNNGTSYYNGTAVSLDDVSWSQISYSLDLSWSGLNKAELYIETSSTLADIYLDDASLTK